MTSDPLPSGAPLHIVIDARTINSSTGTVIERLLHHLQRIDAHNRYTIVLDRRDRHYWRPSTVNFTTVAVDIPQYSLAEQLVFRRVLTKLKPDLIHFCMPQQPLFLFRQRKVTSFHDLTTLRIRNPHLSAPAFALKNAIGRFAFRTAARESARIIACSDYTRQDVIRTLGVDPARVAMIYDAGQVSPEAPEPIDLPFRDYLLYVGSQFAYKNVKRLCDAHHRLRAIRPDLGLVLAGRPDRESGETRRYCAERGYDGVLFTGFVSNAQRNWLYEHAAAYVFPSLAEGFGLPGLEAMGHGTPVVSSEATCLPEVYGDGALYFDPTSVDAMTAQIERVLADETLRAAMVERGQATFARYSWERMAQQVHALYLEVGGTLARRSADRA